MIWDRVFLVRHVLSDLQAAVARLEWAHAETNTRLKELKRMTVVVAEPGDRAGALAELWQLRDELSVSDPDLAAQLHAIYNQLVVSDPNRPDGA